VAIVLLLALGLVRLFAIQVFDFPSPSMRPTIEVGDRVFVNKLLWGGVGRGDIVVFEPPATSRELLQRVVAVGGDTVESRGDVLFVNGQPVDEPYIRGSAIGNPVTPTTIPAGQLYVMGDNRTNSSDSRVFGPIDEGWVNGRVFLTWSSAEGLTRH
jgi:signal peptidase I